MDKTQTAKNSPEINLVKDLLEQHYGIKSAIIKQLPGELDLNFYLENEKKKAYILKISHRGEDGDYLQMQIEALLHLNMHTTELQFPHLISSIKNEQLIEINYKGEQRLMRLLTWVEGKLWARFNPHTPELLYSLGKACGELSKSLQTFDHPAAHRWIKWDPAQTKWVKEHLHHITEPKEHHLAQYFLKLFEQIALPLFPHLRQSVNHNDANDYNILLTPHTHGTAQVISVIDFGDMVYTHTINELAIAAAYALMFKPDPLTAAVELVKGYHEVYPLTETELIALFPLIAGRLLISVTASAINRFEHPENAYLQVSEKAALELLEKLRNISPVLAHMSFREACKYEPCPQRILFNKWAKKHAREWGKLVDFDLETTPKHILDLSVGSLELGNNADFETAEGMDRQISLALMGAGVELGIGRYNEIRPIYSTDSYLVMSNEGPQWRTVHIGLDVFLPAGRPIYAGWDATVHSFANNVGERDYGPTIILKHTISEELSFYTLYGHLSLDSLEGLTIGQAIHKGEEIARIGDMPINGNWSPHLHFQVMLDMMNMKGDFPGVAFPHQQAVMNSLCPDPNILLGMEGDSLSVKELAKKEILAKRKTHLGKSLSVSYEKPLKIQRAFMQYLYASDGRRYLDTVNNVPHVGHQHPRVVRAAQKQLAVLNTNTRYLHETIIHFAEELAATFPKALSVVHFVNSGSEANELALRMARTYTQQKDMVVVEVGYHGNTNACIDISSYKFDSKGGQGAADYIHKVPIPDTYRGLYRSADTGKKYAAHIQEAIEKVHISGKGVSGFICESILSCGGQIVLPKGYLAEAFKYVREAGGLCIMDEVQVGFGRVGEAFWGFELQGVVPDIVTMGKPIGNGHPLGAVVCTQEVADAFANGMEYFNTFGGNPVSCAIGREVLSIIQDDSLQAHAFQMGNYLKKGLNELMQQHLIIGDVRGHGLFLGFELVNNRETLEPAADQATYLANRMRAHGILMSTDGPFHNVLKIKPPLAFQRENADFLLEVLDEVLGEEYLKR